MSEADILAAVDDNLIPDNSADFLETLIKSTIFCSRYQSEGLNRDILGAWMRLEPCMCGNALL